MGSGLDRGFCLSPPHPSPAAIVRGRARAWLDIFERWFCISLDTHDGQNDYGCGFSGVGAAKAHLVPIVRKFYDVTHRLSPLTAGADP
jgi:hypothetical protein